MAAPAKDLEKAIAAWDTDLRLFVDATGEEFPEANRRLGLINMCPDRLRTHLRTGGREKFPHYDDRKTEITDWLIDEARRSKTAGGRAAALGTAELPAEVLEGSEKEIGWSDEKWNEYSAPYSLQSSVRTI